MSKKRNGKMVGGGGANSSPNARKSKPHTRARKGDYEENHRGRRKWRRERARRRRALRTRATDNEVVHG